MTEDREPHEPLAVLSKHVVHVLDEEHSFFIISLPVLGGPTSQYFEVTPNFGGQSLGHGTLPLSWVSCSAS